MALTLERRRLLQLAAFGAGVAATHSAAYAQILGARGFTHGVASGEPGQTSVLLWTRYVPASGDFARLKWEVSDGVDFTGILASGEAESSGERDHCLKVVAGRLKPDRWYFYRFRDAAGRASPVGRTRTLPEGRTRGFKLALFSCSNIGFGWFNAYAHAAERNDLDLAVHVGDYLYEYQSGRYPSEAEGLRPAALQPRHETVALADYRLRFAAYRADPDLQRLHQLLPMIAMWDDHESANDSWADGAQNHQADSEGPWLARKSAAMQAFHEWMPVGDGEPRSYDIGTLATIILPETRLTGRSRQLSYGTAVRERKDIAAALSQLRDGAWNDPARTMLGSVQENWLSNQLRASRRRGATWQVLAQQVLVGSLAMPPEAADWVAKDTPATAQTQLQLLLAASKLDLPYNLDSWDGYPAARTQLLEASLAADANLIVLSGNSHNAWAFDLDHRRSRVGVEIGGQSVTSPGHERDLRHVPIDRFTRAIVARNPQLKWANHHQRGYATVELTPERAIAEWLFMNTVRERTTAIAASHRMTTLAGTRRFAA